MVACSSQHDTHRPSRYQFGTKTQYCQRCPCIQREVVITYEGDRPADCSGLTVLLRFAGCSRENGNCLLNPNNF